MKQSKDTNWKRCGAQLNKVDADSNRGSRGFYLSLLCPHHTIHESVAEIRTYTPTHPPLDSDAVVIEVSRKLATNAVTRGGESRKRDYTWFFFIMTSTHTVPFHMIWNECTKVNLISMSDNDSTHERFVQPRFLYLIFCSQHKFCNCIEQRFHWSQQLC